jgi:trehalose 6-phosphate phosphatase
VALTAGLVLASPVAMRMAGAGLTMLLDALRHHAREEWLIVAAFDGILTRYQTNPAAVWLQSRQKSLLRQIADLHGVTLAVISGRRVADLRARACIGEDVFYIGLHGLEVVGPEFVRVDRSSIERLRDLICALESNLSQLLVSMPGVRLENKEATIALHTRGADSGEAIWSRLLFLSRAAALTDTGRARLIRGYDLLEVLPNKACPRATAIRAVRDAVEQRAGMRPFVFYLGTDVIDDDAFDAVRERGIGVAVDRRIADADYHLSTREGVDTLLMRVASAWRRAGRRAYVM